MIKEIQYISEEYLNESIAKEKVEEVPNNVLSGIDKPLVSVILITYQHIEYIEDSINGIINQKADFDWELIIGDDDSNDGTKEVCINYARENPDRIRLFLNKRTNNLSVLGKPCGIFQITYCILKARGKYIALCSGDDVWQDELKIYKQVEYLEKNKNCSLTYHAWIERYKTEDPSYKTIIRKDFPKASTTVFLNINKELPVNFLNVMQEDSFLQFILKSKGDFHYLESTNPVIVNAAKDSLWRSLDIYKRNSQALNLYENILYAYFRSPLKTDAIRYLLSLYKVIIKQTNLKNFIKTFFMVVRSVVKITKYFILS